jgi:hypothetical protein
VRRSLRQPVAASLAGVAALAFVIAPILHAEAHRNEAAQSDRERSAAFERIFDIVFSGASAARRAELQHALTSVLGPGQAGGAHVQAAGEPPHRHGSDGGAPRHSHGQGPHGAGSLQHLAAALHVAPPAPTGPAHPAAQATVPRERPAPVFLSLISQLVEQSQGPPSA